MASVNCLPVPVYEESVENFALFIERVVVYLQVMKIAEKDKLSYLCLLIGAEKFKILKETVAPKKIEEKTFDECISILLTKFDEKKCVIAERYKFYNRKQQSGETIKDFIAAIKSLSISCLFKSFLDEALRDKLVCGLNNEAMTRRLLSEDESLTFEKACEIVDNMEAVIKSSKILNVNQTSEVNQIQKSKLSWEKTQKKNHHSRPEQKINQNHQYHQGRSNSRGNRGDGSPSHFGSRKRCERCYVNHQPEACPSKNWKCYKCLKIGHTSKFCSKSSHYTSLVNQVHCIYNLNTCNIFSSDAVTVPLSINGELVSFMVDTGSSSTLVSYDTYVKQFKSYKLSPFHGKFFTANHQNLFVMGFFMVTVSVDSKTKIEKEFPLFVIKNLISDAILGRNWLNVIYPNWENNFTKAFQASAVKIKSGDNENANKNVRHNWPTASSPFERVHLDFFDLKGSKYLLICDAYSKWVECFYMKTTTYSNLLSKLSEVFSRFAFPQTIVCDNGPPFSCKEFSKFCKEKSIKLLFSPPYNPESNGLAERSVQTFKKILIKFMFSKYSKNLSPAQRLFDCLYTYRSTPTTVTGVSPMAKLFSYEPRTPLLIMSKENQSENNVLNENKTERKYVREFKENDKVLVYLKQIKSKFKWVQAIIKLKLSPWVYLVQIINGGEIKKVHVNQLKISSLKSISSYDCPDNVGYDFANIPSQQNKNESIPGPSNEYDSVQTRSGRIIKPPVRFCPEL